MPVASLFNPQIVGRVIQVADDPVHTYSVENYHDGYSAILLPGEFFMDLGLKNPEFGDHLCLSSIGIVWVEGTDVKECEQVRNVLAD